MTTNQKPVSRRKFILLVLFVFFVGGLTLHFMSERAAEKAWDEYKVAAAARGESMDWEKYVPVAPPDAENFYAAPIVQKWIPKKTAAAGPAGARLVKPEVLKSVKAKEAPARSLKVTAETMAGSPTTPHGFGINTPAPLGDLQKLPRTGPPDEANLESLHTWFEQWNEDYEAFRAAAKRPQVYLPGDYSMAPSVPIVNFVRVRTIAQATVTKANINLLLHRPAEARKDLESIEAMVHVLDSRPRTLIAGMIQVAVTGLYLSAVHDGIEAKLWTPEELKSIQAYVERIDLLTTARQAFIEGEKVGICNLLDATVTSSGALKTMRDLGEDSKMRELALALMPRGWMRRNELYIVGVMDQTTSVVDVKAHRFYPTRAKALGDRLQQELNGFSVNRMIASVVIPNFSKAFQTTAKNQTMAYHAAISCAMERYKAAKGSYPDKLSQLQPEFITSLPNDVIGSAPMRYVQNGNGYWLYSIGLDERDGGGDEKDDWVWKI